MSDVPTTRVKWTEIANRFTHIDATFVEADCRLGPNEASSRYVVRFYPWWEHPDYLAAAERGTSWGFDFPEDAAQDVVVRPLRRKMFVATSVAVVVTESRSRSARCL